MYKRFHHNNQRRRSGFRRPLNNAATTIDQYIKKAESQGPVEEIEVKGSFEDFGLNPIILKNISKAGYTHPTNIQSQAIGKIIEGKDLVAISNTGTGKTAAFILPIIEKCISDKRLMCLVLVPTRELAIQVVEETKKYTGGTNVSSVSVYGGVGIYGQIQALKRYPNIVVATPGRLKDISKRNGIDLRNFEIVVLDEVDRMLDIGFLPDIRMILSQLSPNRQSLFFSATVSRQIEQIIADFSKNPVKIVTKSTEAAKLVDQDIVKFNKDNKFERLVTLLNKPENNRVILFVRTKRGADELGRKLYNARVKSDVIHGNKNQYLRSRAVSNLKTMSQHVLVATDVAARGIDIPKVDLVVNYDEPATREDYIHRIGRTGRAGSKGRALTFVPEK